MAASIPVATLESYLNSQKTGFIRGLSAIKATFDTHVSSKNYKDALHNITTANALTRHYHGFRSVHQAVILYPHLNVFTSTELQGFIRDDSVYHHERTVNRLILGYLRKEAMRLPNLSTSMISSSGMDVVMFTCAQPGSPEDEVITRYIRHVNRKLYFGRLTATAQYSVAQSSRVLAITFEVAISNVQRSELVNHVTTSLSAKVASTLGRSEGVELTPMAAGAGNGISVLHDGFCPSDDIMDTVARVTAAFRNISRFSHERYAL